MIGDSQIISFTSRKSKNGYEKEDLTNGILKYATNSGGSSISNARLSVLITPPRTRLKSVVEQEKNMMEFMDVFKRAVSRHSMVGFDISNNDMTNKSKDKINITEQRKGEGRSSLTPGKSRSLIDKNGSSLLIMESPHKMPDEKMTDRSRSNLSISQPSRKSKTRSNLLLTLPERESMEHHYGRKSIKNINFEKSLLARKRNGEDFHKEEVHEIIEAKKIPSDTFLQSKPRLKRFSSVDQKVSSKTNFQIDLTESLNTTLVDGIKKRSISDREFSFEDDLKYLLPHLEKVADDNVLRRSRNDLNGIEDTWKQVFQNLHSTDEEVIGSFEEASTIENLPNGSLEDAEKGVAFKEKTESLVHEPQGVQRNSTQQSIKEDLPITGSSKSPIEVYLGGSSEEIEDSASDEQEDLESSGSFLVDKNMYGFNYKYKGDYDMYYLRANFGCLKWTSSETRKFCGNFQYNSLHGEGYYFIKREGCCNIYDGKFYNNKLHGYGQLIYNNGDKFEGLFRENVRFGPGIFTYMDESQDVGIWYGNSIIRLSVDTSAIIPEIGRTNGGKLKLLEYKKIIPLNSKYTDTAYSIMEGLNTDEDTKKRFKELYNPQVRNSNSSFFDKSQYDRSYFEQEDFYIDVIDTTSDVYDFIHKKTGYYPERLKEDNLIQVGYSNKMRKELKCLKRKIKSLRTQLKNDEHNSEYCRDSNIQLRQKELFLRNVLKFLSFKLKKIEKTDELDYPSKKIFVDSIVAWNNCDVMIDILKHSFVCRKSENNVSFNVRSVLTGNRKEFCIAGAHEKSCTKFLESCLSSDPLFALQLLTHANVNPNVCDSKGNSGLHLATWSHNMKMIGMLANYGANLDIVNDEGISPLNLCLLRYLESIYEVNNWETSFLFMDKSVTNLEYLTLWRPAGSYWKILQTQTNLSDYSSLSRKTLESKFSRRRRRNSCMKSSKSSRSSGEPNGPSPTRFIFNLEFVSVPKRFAMDSNMELRYLDERKMDAVRTDTDEAKILLRSRLAQEVAVLKSLLHYGADPNKEGVPYASFFMALFSKSPEIVRYFLAARADPNMNFYGMTPLQVVASLEPCDENCEIMQLLIDNCSNPNILSDPSIWQQCDKYLLGNFEHDCQIQARGKDALHFICLREDFSNANNHFLHRMARILITSKLNTRVLYLGHTHITMAIIKGNVTLVEFLSKYLDLERPLGFGLGNALTILALPRYQNILPFDVCKRIIDLLLFEKISPFEPIYCYFNIFEFLDDNSPPDLEDNQSAWRKYMNHVRSIRASLKSRSQEDTEVPTNELSKFYIQQKSRDILVVINRFKAVFYLYCFIREGSLDRNTSYLAKLIGNSQESLKYIQYIFNSGKMPRYYLSLEYVAEMMKYVDNANNVRKKIKVKPEEMLLYSLESEHNDGRVSWPSKKGPVRLDEEASSFIKSQKKSQERAFFRYFNREDYMKELADLNFEECDDASFADIPRWVSEEYIVKCNVCYFCMHRTNKILLRCPYCGIVKFCSKKCNYLSLKLKDFHPCPGLFYHQIYNEYRELIKNKLPLPIYGIDLIFDNLRRRPNVIPGRMSSSKTEDGTMEFNTPKSVKVRLPGGDDNKMFGPLFDEKINSEKVFENGENEIFYFEEKHGNIEYSTECNQILEKEIVENSSSSDQHNFSRRIIRRKVLGNKKTDKKEDEIEKDLNVQTVFKILEDSCRNITGTAGNITSEEIHCTNDAKRVTLLPYIEKKKHFHENITTISYMENKKVLKKFHIPTISNKRKKISATRNTLNKVCKQ